MLLNINKIKVARARADKYINVLDNIDILIVTLFNTILYLQFITFL